MILTYFPRIFERGAFLMASSCLQSFLLSLQTWYD